MEADVEVENEGVINIPKVMKIENKVLLEKKLEFKGHRRKSVSTTYLPVLLLNNNPEHDGNVNDDEVDNNDNDNDKLNTSIEYDKNKIWLKNEDKDNTSTSKSSINDDKVKIKKVTFSTVEIIRVKNYKRYNKLNTAKKNEEEAEDIFNDCVIF